MADPISSTLEINFAFECNPWRISDSSMDYGIATAKNESYYNSTTKTGEPIQDANHLPKIPTYDATGNIINAPIYDTYMKEVTYKIDSLKLFTGASIERNKAFSGDYFFAFDILDIVGNSSLTFGLKSYLGVVNNLAEGEYTSKWKSPSLTFLDRVGDVVTVCVGYRKGLMDKNHFDEVGRFNWNINTRLPVIAYVKDEIVVPENTNVYRASEISTRVSFSDSLLPAENVKVDQMLGVVVEAINPKSVVMYDIPAHSSRVVSIPNVEDYPEGTKFFITKKGNAQNSELIIASSQQFYSTGVWTYTLREESTAMIYKWSDGWSIQILDNFIAYRVNKKMKLRVNGVETDYVPVSNCDLDYIMMNLSEVNSEFDSYVELGPIRGGCL